jgi:hypothetical protein
LLSPSRRVYIAKVAVSLECLVSCGGTAPLPHRRQLRHHAKDIDDTNAVVDSHDMIAVIVTRPVISTVAFHSGGNMPMPSPTCRDAHYGRCDGED